MKRIFPYLFGILIICRCASFADNTGTGSPFSFGAGARPLSMGGTGVAVSDPATAAFWNPSGLCTAERITVTGFHSRLYESDVAYQYFGMAWPTLDWGCLGIGIFRLGISGIEKRDEGNLLLGTIEDERLSFYFAYGRKVSGFNIGLALNMESHTLDTYKATSSPGLNLSVSRDFELKGRRLRRLSLNMNGRNIIRPTMKLSGSEVKYPYAADVGVALETRSLLNEQHSLIFTVSALKVDYLDPALSAGIEYGFNDLAFIRGGIRDKKLSVGAGISWKFLTFDYALVERDLGSLHLFSITSSFGQTISEKRKLRLEKREAEFNSMMNNRLTDQYQEMISDLSLRGQKMFEADSLEKAVEYFDRALFLARTGTADTSQIYQMAQESHRRLEENKNMLLYEQYMDSSATAFNDTDYMSARHFAGLALSIYPDSENARTCLERSNEAIGKMMSREEIIQKELLAIDSLLGYGQIKEALASTTALTEYAPGDNRIVMARRKAKFEYWKEKASAAFNSDDYTSARTALDTALSIFPGHKWCLKIRDEIDAEIKKRRMASQSRQEPTAKPVSKEILREAESSYETAQELFRKGELTQAVALWEKVNRIVPGYQSVRSLLVKAYKFIGVELYGQNRLEDAIETWEKAILIDPENEEINAYIVRTRSEITKLKELSYEHH